MAKNSKSQFAILGMLAVLKKSSGYDLKKHMEATTQYFWKETFSSIYPVLEDLEKQNLITRVEEETKNERNRNVYALTSEGLGALKNWLMQPPEPVQLRDELMLKLFFGNMVPIEVNIEHLEKQKLELENKLSIYREIKQELSNDSSSEALYSLFTLDLGIRRVLTTLEWCDHSIKALKKI
jgi:PadR family transcriptional regulator AphA